MRILNIFLLISLVLFVAVGCEEDSNPADVVVDPQLSVSLSSLDFGTGDTALTFTISNTGGDTLDWTISDDQDWLETSLTSGATLADDSTGVTATVSRSGLSPNNYSGTILIVSDYGSAAINVTMTTGLQVSVTSLAFSKDDSELTFTIINTSGDTLNWTITDDMDWLETSLTSGATLADDSTGVTATVDRSGLLPYNYSGTISISSSYGNATIDVIMTAGMQIWSYQITNNTNLNLDWTCSDENDASGEDFWGVVDSAHNNDKAIWCNGQGEHPEGVYDNNMEAWMAQEAAIQKINIQDFTDVTIRFQLKYQTENDNDFVDFTVQDVDGYYIYLVNRTHWTGDGNTWQQYTLPLSLWNNAPNDVLAMAFIFVSDNLTNGLGVYIDNIEVWGNR